MAETCPVQKSHSTAFLASLQPHIRVAAPDVVVGEVIERTKRHRPALGHCGEHLSNQVGTLLDEPRHAAPGVAVAHAPAQQRVQLRLVRATPRGPSTRRPRRSARLSPEPRRQHLAPVRAEPGKERQLVRARQDVDRVDLHHADAVEHAAQVSTVDGSRAGRWSAKPWAARAMRRASSQSQRIRAQRHGCTIANGRSGTSR